MNEHLARVTDLRNVAFHRMKGLVDTAEREHRDLTAAEQAEFDAASADMDALKAREAALTATEARDAQTAESLRSILGRGAFGPAARDDRTQWTREDGRQAALNRGQRFADHEIVAEAIGRRAEAERSVLDTHGNLGGMLRAMSTTSGSAIVPTVWSAEIIDRARNHAAVLQAGARVIPMDAKTVQIGRVTGDPTAAFRTEASQITASDPSFDNVTLTANTMSCLVVGSVEWFQDADNVQAVVTDAIAKAVAAELDLNALFGGVTAGNEIGATGFNRTLTAPPSPRGVLAALLATASSSVLGGVTNGTTQTATTPWAEILDTVFTPADYNESTTGVIWPSRLARRYAKLTDTTNQPLRTPDALVDVPFYVSNQIPSNMTAGTSTTNMTDVFAGDWSQLLVGQRLGFTIQVLQERYAEFGQIGIIASWRGDIQPARPRAFSVYRYLNNA